ncbi:OprD family outer membrane porin, partial [Acinetobacter baumannii]
YLDKVNHRDSTNYEKIKISGVNGRFKSAETDGLYYLGGNYQFNPALKLTAFYMDVDDLYNQTMVGALHQYKINDTTNFSSQLR